MNAEVERVLTAMAVLAECWRGDWSTFDGRTLRHQLHELEDLLREALKGNSVEASVAGFYANCEACADHLCWREHCLDRHT